METINQLGASLGSTSHLSGGGSAVGAGGANTSSSANAGPVALARKSSDLGSHSGAHGGLGSASQLADLSAAILEAFKSSLKEAEGYTLYYESRMKVEEEFLKGFRAVVEKQRDLDAKIDGKGWQAGIASARASGKAGRTLRGAWYELRENDLRELETRSHMIDTIRQAVVTPLSAFRDSQERIRKRVKEDLKTHLSNYDEMRNVTLPRIKRQYDRKCEEVEALRQQQVAVEDQRALLASQGSSSGGVGHGYDGAQNGAASESVASFGLLSSDRADVGAPSGSARPSNDRALSLPGPDAQGVDPHRSGASALAIERPDTDRNSSGFSNTSGGFSPPSAGGASGQNSHVRDYSHKEKEERDKKPNFFDALRNKEGWETARKEAPKKINAFISRMRDEGGRGLGGLVGGERDKDRDKDVLGHQGHGSSSSEYAGGQGERAGGIFGGHREPSTRSSATQNIALKNVKAKWESEELDRAYRKAIFDLETLRIRREKTILAAIESCKECKRELALTAQASWLQAERAGLLWSSSNVSLKTHAEEVAMKSTDDLNAELRRFEEAMPHIEQASEPKVTYINFWHGECQDLLFGTSLTDYVFSHQRSIASGGGPQPPLIVTKCIEFIESRALKQPGIYRISAKHSALQILAHAIEKNEESFQFDPERDEPAAVAGLLKLYLRQLPEPVLPIPWEERIKYTHEREEHIRKGFPNIKGRIRRAPAINQVTLKAIVEHLARIAAHAEENKMTASNLAVVFAPVLLSEADHETTSLAAAMEEDKTMEDLITFNAVIFGSAPLSTSSEAPFGATAVVSPNGATQVGAPGSTALKRTSAILKSSPALQQQPPGPPTPLGKSSADEYTPQPPTAHPVLNIQDHSAPTLDTRSPLPPTSLPQIDTSGASYAASSTPVTTSSVPMLLSSDRSLSAQSSLGHGHSPRQHSAEGSSDWPGTTGNLYLAASSAFPTGSSEAIAGTAPDNALATPGPGYLGPPRPSPPGV